MNNIIELVKKGLDGTHHNLKFRDSVFIGDGYKEFFDIAYCGYFEDIEKVEDTHECFNTLLEKLISSDDFILWDYPNVETELKTMLLDLGVHLVRQSKEDELELAIHKGWDV